MLLQKKNDEVDAADVLKWFWFFSWLWREVFRNVRLIRPVFSFLVLWYQDVWFFSPLSFLLTVKLKVNKQKKKQKNNKYKLWNKQTKNNAIFFEFLLCVTNRLNIRESERSRIWRSFPFARHLYLFFFLFFSTHQKPASWWFFFSSKLIDAWVKMLLKPRRRRCIFDTCMGDLFFCFRS